MPPDRDSTTSHHRPTVVAENARQSIDDLVADALRYRGSKQYRDLLAFMGRFRHYSPFNALLVHLQIGGGAFVAPASRWRSKYGRRIVPGARPIVLMQPFGPIMLVFDVAQTEPDSDAPNLPDGIVKPFAMPPMQSLEPALGWLVENAKADGVRVSLVDAGSQSAGCIRRTALGPVQHVAVKRRPPESVEVPVRFEVEINRALPATETYATIAHELAHLFCGHLGSRKPDWWPHRLAVPEPVTEFEAESAAYIACLRLDDSARVPPHLEQYLGTQPQVPDGVSLERIAAAAGRVIEMSEGWLKPRLPDMPTPTDA
ncbi:MAG TPA: hypothetical protein VFJ19_05895 [Nocardioidaceae bacterium]|nr:hypothetical protein [Nocardioidaceae bacterium]